MKKMLLNLYWTSFVLMVAFAIVVSLQLIMNTDITAFAIAMAITTIAHGAVSCLYNKYKVDTSERK